MRILLAILLIGVFFDVVGQSNKYRPAYIITQKKPEVKMEGFILDGNWRKTPQSVTFKTNLESQAKKYSPSELLEFGVKDKIYKSHKVDIETSKYHVKHLDYNPEFKIEEKRVFLQVLVDGEKALLKYIRDDAKNLFYYNDHRKYELLRYKKYLSRTDDKTYVVEKVDFIPQFYKYLKGCKNLSSIIKDVDYTEKDLVNLYRNYYECSNETPLYLSNVDKFEILTGIVVGGGLNKLDFWGEYNSHLTESEFSINPGYAIGLFAEFIFPHTEKKWSVYNDLKFGNFSSESDYLDVKSDLNSVKSEMELKYSELSLVNLVRYKFNYEKFEHFINTGVSNNFLFYHKNYRKETNYFGETVRIEDKLLFDAEAKKYELGLVLGTGVHWRKFSGELRYTIGTGISPILALKSKIQKFQFLVSYDF